MQFYTEGILWYLILVDCMIYNILVWARGRWHNKLTHWASEHFPLNKLLGLWYLILVLWLGLALYRMELLMFF